MRRLVLLSLALLLAACGPGYRDKSVPMASIVGFEPERYAGLWYEVASFPTPFQAGCSDTTAEYQITGDGTLRLRNRCLKDGVPQIIDGRARLAGPGRLTVQLDGVPVAADYWVLWVDEGYRTAVVGVPSGRAGWILNRTPEIPADRLAVARDILRFNGYDVSALQMTGQSGE